MNTNGHRQAAPRWTRRQIVQSGLGLTAGSAAAFLLACGGDSDKKGGTAGVTGSGTVAPTAAAAATETPKRGGRLSQISGSANSFNVAVLFTEGYVLGGVHVYDRLVSQRMGKDTAREYVLEAAQSIEQPDPTTIVFKLKPGMKYHDRAPVSGRAVVADDIVKAQLWVKDTPRAENNSFQNVVMQSVEAPDAQTVVFKLKQPNAYVFSYANLSNPGAQCIIPKEQLDKIDTNWPIGSGPYQLAEAELNVRYLYKRFEGYREAARGLPYIAEREWRVLTDAAAAEAAFRSEQLHIWTLPVYSLADPIKRDMGSKIEMWDFLSLSMFTFSANATKPPWNDIRVREAVYRVLNRQQYVDLVEGGRGKVTPGLLSIGLTEYQLEPSQTDKYFRQDPRAGRQLLEAAGYDFNREVEMSTIVGVRNEQGMEVFQQQAAQMGMKVRIQAMPFAQWATEKIVTGNWETWVSGHQSYDSPQVPLRFQHTNVYNTHVYNGLKDPAIDAMIDRSEQTLDRNARIKLVKDIQIALLEKYTPFIFTHNPTTYQARWKYVKDYEVNPSSQPMYRTEMWMDK
jgi:peptide/nickel transport system substrate-binding protein